VFGARKKNKILVRTYSDESGKKNGALLAVHGSLQQDLIRRFNENYAITGSHVKNGGQISPLSIVTLIGSGAGAIGITGAMSGQLFIATANPATLMAIGNGVGSAVMGTGGIAAQAPFIPVAGAIMPVAAPLIAFQAISTIMIIRQFKGIHKRLDNIEENISRVLQRSEATFIAEILSVSNRIDELERQFGICNHFTQDMMIRLALLQEKVNPLFERYRFLYSSESITDEKSSQLLREDLKFRQNDAYFTIVLSILDLKLDLLRSKLVLQDNPSYIQAFVEELLIKIDYYEGLWSSISDNPRMANDVANELQTSVKQMNWWRKQMPAWFGGKRQLRIDTQSKEQILRNFGTEMEGELHEQVTQNLEWGETLRENLADNKPMDLIYWRDENGEHAYYTDELELTIA
jgi:hypothetical protein